jgi:hypothetical protein
VLLGVIAAAGGVGLAIVMGTSAGAAGPTTTTLGSTTGNPTGNFTCGFPECTYVPFAGVSGAELQVPFDGTVTSFSLNANSTGGTVFLRVLRPAGGGQFTGAGTSPSQTITNTGGQTFAVSLPVKAGDVLALDNGSSALLFDNSSSNSGTAYYQPALADAATGAPSNVVAPSRLLLSAVVASSGTTPTTTTNPTVTVTVTKTVTVVTPPGPPPVLSSVKQSHQVWRPSKLTGNPKIPVGTTFSFKLSRNALVNFTFRRGGRARGSISVVGHPGINQVKFRGIVSSGRALLLGRYTVTLVGNTAGGKSKPATLSFRITG